MEENKTVKQKIEYSYNALHRLVSVRYGEDGPVINYAYDPASNLVAVGTDVEPGSAKVDASKQEPSMAKDDAGIPQAEAAEGKAAPALQWYLHWQGQQHGPYTQQQLEQWVKQGYLQPHALSWLPGLLNIYD